MSQLVKDGHVSEGDVVCRSIADIQPSEIKDYERVHLFAGIGGWDLALRLAGWPVGVPVWTGSCPCQPFSSAGKRTGVNDERHLWPEMFRLIKECRPPVVFGEQVATAIKHGWIDGLQADLETEGYTVGHAVLGAHSVGSLHRRQRLYWGAYSSSVRPQGVWEAPEGPRTREQLEGLVQAEVQLAVPTGASGGVAHAVPARVVRLRGYGNAIVPQTAALFVQAFMQAMNPEN